MNTCKNALIAATLSLALAGGAAFAQSTGGGTAGSNGSSQGAAGHRNGTAGGGGAGTNGSNGMQGANGTGGMQSTTKGCENLATSGPQRLPEQNRPVGTPTQGAANKGSTDWSDQPNCVNAQGRQKGGTTRNPSSSGG